jgi:hypothetical protein
MKGLNIIGLFLLLCCLSCGTKKGLQESNYSEQSRVDADFSTTVQSRQEEQLQTEIISISEENCIITITDYSPQIDTTTGEQLKVRETTIVKSVARKDSTRQDRVRKDTMNILEDVRIVQSEDVQEKTTIKPDKQRGKILKLYGWIILCVLTIALLVFLWIKS